MPADSRSGGAPGDGIPGDQVSQQLSGELLRLARSDDDSVGALLVAGRQVDRVFDVWIYMDRGRQNRGCFRTDTWGETARLARLVAGWKVDRLHCRRQLAIDPAGNPECRERANAAVDKRRSSLPGPGLLAGREPVGVCVHEIEWQSERRSPADS